MGGSIAAPEDTGLEVLDIQSNSAFAARRLRPRDAVLQMESMQRLAHAFVTGPDTILQVLVQTAVDLCGADSAGISVERDEPTDDIFYEWVATAGLYSGFLNAMLPRTPSACGICLERQQPQLFRVSQRFFDILGVVAPLVTDGILLPWQVDGTRGTIFIMAHTRPEAFDRDDCRVMQTMAEFASMAIRHQRQQRIMVDQASAAAVAALANNLAHQINNPLQSLTNTLYIASEGLGGSDLQALAQGMADDLRRLSALVNELLNLPVASRPSRIAGNK